MTISAKILFAPVSVLAFLTLAACGDNSATTTPPTSPSAVTDPSTPVPPAALPEAPPEQIAPSTTPDPADPIDGQALPPGSPPPVLPTTPPT